MAHYEAASRDSNCDLECDSSDDEIMTNNLQQPCLQDHGLNNLQTPNTNETVNAEVITSPDVVLVHLDPAPSRNLDDKSERNVENGAVLDELETRQQESAVEKSNPGEPHYRNQRQDVDPKLRTADLAIEPSDLTNAADSSIHDHAVSTDTAQNESLEVETLSDCSVAEEARDESFVLCFPDGESFDLRDKRSHTSIVNLTSTLVNQLEEMEETLSMKDDDITQKTKAVNSLKTQMKELTERNEKISGQLQTYEKELEHTKGLLKSHDVSARTAISRLQKENEEQVKILKAKCAAMQKEKEASVMNYARREKEVLDAKRASDLADKKAKDAVREKDKVVTHMKGLKMDLAKIKSAFDKKDAEVGQFRREAEKWKEEADSHIIKVKWAQNKLKSESDLHNETKEKLTKAVTEIKRLKEEAEQIRTNCQAMIKTYQESEEMRSNSLDSQLKEKEMLLSQQEAKSGELEGIHKQQLDELRKLKQKHKDTLEENAVFKTRVDCLEKERAKSDETLKGYSELLNKQKREAASTSEQLKELEELKKELCSKNDSIKQLEEDLHQEQDSKDQMRKNEENWKSKQQELLEFTQKVSSKNAQLTSESENLTMRLENALAESARTQTLLDGQANELHSLKTQMDSQNQDANDTSAELHKRLQDKETTVNHLTLELEEAKDEIRTIKRKNNANIKDLTRQLQQARKRLEPYESNAFPSTSGPTTEDGSMGSRASSDTSLDCVGKPNSNSNSHSLSHNSAAESGNLANNSTNGSAEVPETMVTTMGEINMQTLIERIVRLQRVHARKNEKIDFLQDHVQQLVDDIQKKNKIIQHYMLREESGMLMPESALSHGVVTEQGHKIPRHLSAEINRKMQSVLEDTLLKNIALKESIDALGKEIARLSAMKS